MKVSIFLDIMPSSQVKSTYFSEEYIASIFRVEEAFFYLLFDLEN
jgi:hypothetical protein